MDKHNNYFKLRKRLESYIGQYPLPTRKQNTENFKKLRKLEKTLPRDQHVYDKLREFAIVSNGGFGMKYAVTYCRKINNNSLIEDIFQQSQIGIIEAVDKFDPKYKVNFTTYAYWYVKKCIVDFIKKNKIVVAPREIAKNMKNVSTVHDKVYTEQRGGPVLAKDIKNKLKEVKSIDLEENKINEITKLVYLNSSLSENPFIIESTSDISDSIECSDCITIIKSIILNEIRELDNTLVEIIKMRFGIGYDRPYLMSEIQLLKRLSNKEMDTFKEQTKMFLNRKR